MFEAEPMTLDVLDGTDDHSQPVDVTIVAAKRGEPRMREMRGEDKI